MKIIANYYPLNTYRNISPITQVVGNTSSRVNFCRNDTFEKSKERLQDEKILAAVKDSLHYENFIGEGYQGQVYKLTGSNYVVKIPYDTIHTIEKGFKRIPTDKTDKHNHVVAKFENGITIMKYIKGTPLNKRKNTNILTELPVEAYSKLLKQICDARKDGLGFDCYGGNIILNTKNKTLTAIDFNPLDKNRREHMSFYPLNAMYQGLAEDFGKKLQTSGMILQAALQEFEPEVEPCTDIENFHFKEFLETIETNNRTIPLLYPDKWNKLKGNLTDIKTLKLMEQDGEDVKEILKHKLESTREVISYLIEVTQ